MAPAPGGNIRFWLKGYLFLGVAVLFLAILIYSNHLIARMRENSEATSRLFARYLENVIFEVADDGSLANLRAVLQESDLPIVVTVFDGIPIMWTGIPYERTEADLDLLATMDVDNPPTPKLRRIVEMYREFDKKNAPIPIQVVGAGDVPTGWVHFGPSPLQRELRYMPFVLLGIFLVFMAVAIQGLRYLKLSEQRSIWVGLAKETAHQLGTPLSAMLGWVQVIRDRATERGYDDVRGYVDEMEVDLARLTKVTERFSKIGAAPERAEITIESVLARTVAYFEKRWRGRWRTSRSGCPAWARARTSRSRASRGCACLATRSCWSGSSRISSRTRSTRWAKRAAPSPSRRTATAAAWRSSSATRGAGSRARSGIRSSGRVSAPSAAGGDWDSRSRGASSRSTTRARSASRSRVPARVRRSRCACRPRDARLHAPIATRVRASLRV
jgi:hypothetical protein